GRRGAGGEGDAAAGGDAVAAGTVKSPPGTSGQRRTSMPPADRDIPWVGKEFIENVRKFPQDELMRYAGQHIAWSLDGARILASDPDRATLYRKLDEAGIDSALAVIDWGDWADKAIL